MNFFKNMCIKLIVRMLGVDRRFESLLTGFFSLFKNFFRDYSILYTLKAIWSVKDIFFKPFSIVKKTILGTKGVNNIMKKKRFFFNI